MKTKRFLISAKYQTKQLNHFWLNLFFRLIQMIAQILTTAIVSTLKKFLKKRSLVSILAYDKFFMYSESKISFKRKFNQSAL